MLLQDSYNYKGTARIHAGNNFQYREDKTSGSLDVSSGQKRGSVNTTCLSVGHTV